ncbi:MAG TPA: polymer-forming cytoskeletal protein [Micropepsaceae bacterium]|jgi:cytoskeletal protein CcmA (bactofilin family)|nr:polymer-forming cytoskeletal protein [Micropepsaceae bacterium]
MFSKTKEAEAAVAPPPPAAPPKRTGRNGGVPSIISAELIVRGTLVSAGDVTIDGKVDGDIRAASLVIGEKAVITGDVFAEEAIVRGRVEGSIRARKVQLCSTCHVEGNIMHEAFSVESGAFFEGNCRHTDNPLADAPELIVGSDHKASTGAQPVGERRPPPPPVQPGVPPVKPAGVLGL